MSNMEQLVNYIAKTLVTMPDQVEVKRTETEQAVTIELHVAPEDMGKVIGKQGRIAKSIRTLVKAATIKDEKPTFVEIL